MLRDTKFSSAFTWRWFFESLTLIFQTIKCSIYPRTGRMWSNSTWLQFNMLKMYIWTNSGRHTSINRNKNKKCNKREFHDKTIKLYFLTTYKSRATFWKRIKNLRFLKTQISWIYFNYSHISFSSMRICELKRKNSFLISIDVVYGRYHKTKILNGIFFSLKSQVITTRSVNLMNSRFFALKFHI